MQGRCCIRIRVWALRASHSSLRAGKSCQRVRRLTLANKGRQAILVAPLPLKLDMPT